MPNQTIAIVLYWPNISSTAKSNFLPNFPILKSYFFRYKIIAALVTIVISMCCPKTSLGAPYSPQTGRRGSQSKLRGKVIHHTCTESKSYFFRSQCSDNGFLTIVKNQVLVQTTGLNVHHSDAEFMVETCSRLGTFPPSSSSSSPIVRYRHKKSRKYICFTKRGKVRTVVSLFSFFG